MTDRLFLDTHAVIWLAEGQSNKFSHKGHDLLSKRRLLISPMVRLELNYLKQKLRFNEEPDVTLAMLRDQINLQVDELPLNTIIGTSLNMNWTRDVFDLLITAQAKYYNCPLLTKDRKITAYYQKAKW